MTKKKLGEYVDQKAADGCATYNYRPTRKKIPSNEVVQQKSPTKSLVTSAYMTLRKSPEVYLYGRLDCFHVKIDYKRHLSR